MRLALYFVIYEFEASKKCQVSLVVKYMTRCRSFLDRRNYFFKEGSGVKILQKLHFLEVNLRISEIHLQQQIHDTSKERLKNDY